MTWVKKLSLKTARSDLSAQTIKSLIYLTGGCISDQSIAKDSNCPNITNSMEIYNPQTDSITIGTPMPRPRYRHSTVVVAQRYLFVIGGRDLQDNIVQPIDIYDVVSGTWSTHPKASMSSDCCSDSIAFVLADVNTGYDNIYLPGGYYANYSASNEVLILKTLNTSTEGTFQRGLVANSNYKRGDAMSLVYNNHGFVSGGFLENSFCSPIGNTEEYDPVKNTWTVRSSLAHARADGAAVMIDSHLFILGGETKDKSCNFSLPVSDVEKYDVPTNSWSDFIALPTSRFRQSGEIYKDTIYVFGGQIENSTTGTYQILDWIYALNISNTTTARSNDAPSVNMVSIVLSMIILIVLLF